jgi:hypothetical protein
MKKFQNRFPAAALALLLPLGAAVVVEPAAAQPRGAVVAPAALIERFVVRPMGRVQAGEELRFRLSGAPGGRAWVDIPGVVGGLALQEIRPGVYEGSYTVRRRDDLDAFARSVATLQSGSQRASARVDVRGDDRDDRWDRDDRRGRRDGQPPQITQLSPGNGDRLGERGRVQIGARLSDDGRGVDRNSVTLRVDGRDVTRQARITDDEVQYRADLDPGRHSVELAVRDRAGNLARKAWSFDVVDADRDRRERDRDARHVIPLGVTSHADGAFADLHHPFVMRGRTLPGAVVHAVVHARFGGPANFSQLVLDRTVRADANGNFVLPVDPVATRLPTNRHEVVLTVTGGGVSAQQRLTLHHRG